MKVNAYKCDRCNEWVEEDEVTHANTMLTGKRVGRYTEDLCSRCAEKAVPLNAEQARQKVTVLAPSRPRGPLSGPNKKHTPEEVGEALRLGTAMLKEGQSLEAVCARFQTTTQTWVRWAAKAEAASASRSASQASADGSDRTKSGP